MPVPSNMPEHAKTIFEHTMESLKGKTNKRTGKPYTDEERAQIAWSAVKNKYKKVGEKWEAKEEEYYEGDLDGTFEFKAEDGKYFFKGYLSTFDIDLVNDLVTPDCMKDMLNQINAGLGGFVRNLKGSPDHDVYWTQDSARLPISKLTSANLDNKGLFVEGMFNPDHPDFKSVWSQIQNGFLDGLSIEYKPVDFAFKDVSGKKVRVLNKVLLKGYGHTPRPANPYSTLTDCFVKSLEIKEAEETMEENDIKSVVSSHLHEDIKEYEKMIADDKGLLEKLGDAIVEAKSEDEEEWTGEDENEEAIKARVTAQEGHRKEKGESEEEYYAFPRLKKLPIFDEAHVRNAMARFNQTQGMTAEEKATAKRKIVRAAKKYGIEVGEFAKVGPETKSEVEKVETKEEIKAEPQPAPQTEVKEEPKVEVKAEEIKSLEEKIRTIVKEEIKSLVPEKKNLSDSSDKFPEVKSEPSDLVGFVVKSLGVK